MADNLANATGLSGMRMSVTIPSKLPPTLLAAGDVLVAVLDSIKTLNDPNTANNVIVGSSQITAG